MRLEVKNIGKIGYADVKLEGLTILVGSNSTGKSTVSKSLYTLVRGFNNFDELYQKEYYRRIFREIGEWAKLIYVKLSDEENVNGMENIVYDDTNYEKLRDIRKRFKLNSFVNNFNDIIDRINIKTEEKFIESITDFFGINEIEIFLKNKFNYIYNEVKGTLADLPSVYKRILKAIDNDIIERQLINKIITECMEERIMSQFDTSNNSGIFFYEDADEEPTVFMENIVSVDRNRIRGRRRSITNNIVYVQPLHILDKREWTEIGNNDSMSTVQTLFSQLKEESASKEVEDIEKADIILKQINSIMEKADTFDNEPVGELNIRNDFFSESMIYIDSQLEDAITFNNVASGIKNIVIIKRLIKNVVIREKSFLVFDEPEVNLHPDWQLKLAEILVMLQKELKLRVLINTHSPYFMRALECYSDIYGTIDNLNIYHMKHSKENKYQFYTENISDKDGGVAELYQELSKPFIKLQELLEKKYGE